MIVPDEDTIVAGQGVSEKVAVMRLRKKKYLEEAINVLENLDVDIAAGTIKTVTFGELENGMIFSADVFTQDETLLASRGDVINETIITRLQNFRESKGLIEPFKIIHPPPEQE